MPQPHQHMPKRLKIAYLTTQFYEVKSGPGRFAGYLREFKFKQLDLHFFSDQIKEAKPGYWPVYEHKTLSKWPLYYFLRAYYLFKAVYKAQKTVCFDAWFCSSYVEALFLLFYKPEVPVYVCVNDYNALLIFKGITQKIASIGWRKTLARILTRIFEQAVTKNADYVVANSLYNKDLIIKHYNITVSRCLLLYKVVDLSFFEYKERPITKLRQFLFVKNDYMRGGLDTILQALAQLPHTQQITLSIAGISPENQLVVSDMVKHYGMQNRVTILGLVDKNTLKTLYHTHDVFISMAREEALGVACMEAMASGIPVIATNVGGLPEVLDNGNAAFMIPPNNAEALVDLLTYIEQNPVLISEKIQHGRIQIRKFDFLNLEQNLLRLFENLK